MNTQKNFLLSVLTILVLFFQLMSPITVRADDGATPPPDVTPEVTTTPVPTDATDVPEITSTPPTDITPEVTATPVPTDAADVPEMTSIPPLTELTVDPVETSTPLPTMDSTEIVAESPVPTEPVPTEEIVAVEEPTVAEVLADIPAGTDLVVLDENGNLEPLVSQEAAEIIATGDPIWCPDGVTPAPNTNGCTASYTTMADLLANAGNYINGQNVNGTIWITSGLVGDTSPIVIDGLVYQNWANYSLTLQGGWEPGPTPPTGTNSSFNVTFNVNNWNNDIIINNIDFNSYTRWSTSKNVTFYNSNSYPSGIAYSHVNLNGAGNALTVSPGQTVDLTFDFQIWATGNQVGATVQIVPGLDQTPFGECSYDGGPPAYPGTTGSAHHQFVAPSTPGTYYIRASRSMNGYCNGLDYNPTEFVLAKLIVPPPDRDSDGIIDSEDACPDVPGIKTDDPLTNGCPPPPDRDSDGIIDSEDTCPDISGIKTDDPLTNGCPPPPDRDNDGIVDSVDACPDIPGIKTDNPLTNGCPPPPPDRDNDGIIDSVDACPDVPGVKTDDPLTNGCPQKLISVEGNSEMKFPMDCSLFSSYKPVWSNGDHVVISCVPNGTISAQRKENKELLGKLDDGYQYASGLIVQILENGVPLAMMPPDGFIQVSFAAEESDAQYGIMYWDEDASTWVLLEGFQKNPNGTAMWFPLYPQHPPQDFRTIKRGTQSVPPDNPNRVEVTTNFTGIFVLVVQQ